MKKSNPALLLSLMATLGGVPLKERTPEKMNVKPKFSDDELEKLADLDGSEKKAYVKALKEKYR